MSAADHELDYRKESFADMCAREDREEHFQEKKDQLRRVVKKANNQILERSNYEQNGNCIIGNIEGGGSI
ncbi:MAG: hypothetical protein PHS33_07595 [Candidatus Omnitrophica bacterium]|nr:hypothetical protein [Candidatus Omnitrophota bacterium]